MLKNLGFPSLYTKMVDVDLNGNIYRAIFQEDATKEFLERNNFTETVILKENDFNFYLSDKEKEIYDNFFTSSFVIDNNNFLKNDISNFITSEAIALKANQDFKKLVMNDKFFTSIHRKYASHGLGTNNRKYIYIPYKKIFLPLYYDGDVQFLPGRTDCSKSIDEEKLIKFKTEFKLLAKKNLNKMQECVLRDVLDSSKGNIEKLGKFFPENNTNNKKDLQYLEIKNKILNYLKINDTKEILEINKSKEKILIYSFILNDQFFICSLSIKEKSIKSCNQIDGQSYKKLISESGRYKITDNFKSFPINLGTFNNQIPIIKLNIDKNDFTLDEKATYYFIQNDEKDRNIKFTFQNSEAKLFLQGNFENINFEFKTEYKNYFKSSGETRYDKNLLTGCVNFFDSTFEKVSLKSSDMICEDSINIKNSSGSIEKIEINNSLFDGLDLDFSDISINNLLVNNAKNDCIDFSFGKYIISKANLKNCGDKGVSVGEKSKFKLQNAKIFNSKIGVASKDDAVTKINTILIEDINICLAAYNKKKEFKGSEISVKNFNCNRYQIKQQADDLSKIQILN